jgi:hypothetical protein
VNSATLKLALWSGSLGLIAIVLRRFVRKRRVNLEVGNVSADWLAQQRGSGDPYP